MARLSVVMPVFDVAPFVEAAARSVLAQTFSDFELIVVDDGSTDDTAQVVERIGDARISIHRMRHEGLVGAENHGLGLSSGEYVVRCDGDDLYLPTLFERQVEILDSQANVVAVGAWAREFGGRQIAYRAPSEPADIRRALRWGNPLSQPVMMRTEAVREVGGFRQVKWEDWDLWIRLAARHDLRNIPEYLVLLRSRPGSLFRGAGRVGGRRAKLDARLTAARYLGIDARSLRYLLKNVISVAAYRILDPFLPRPSGVRESITARPAISVVVPTYRRPELLARCLEAVLQQEPAPEEIIVVHRTDDAETATFMRDWRSADPSRRRSVLVREPGLVHALAAGTKEARGGVVAYLDDDAIPRPGWLFELGLAFLDPTVGAAGGRLVDHIDGREVTGRTRVVGTVTWYGRVIGRHHLENGHYGDVDWLTGSNMAIRRDLAVHDETLRMTRNGLALANDLDTCLTVKRAGARVLYSPWAVVEHHTTSFRDPVLGSRVAGSDIETSAANHTYAICKSLRGAGRSTHAVYAFIVGSASLPGPVRAAVELLVAPRRGMVMIRRIPSAWRGRRAGFRLARRWRSHERDRSPSRPVVATPS